MDKKCYHCLEEVGMKFIIASYIKLFYIFFVLILVTYKYTMMTI